ncbi:uncharacterized protein [Oryza sativa Japonica Group]|uniref:uncharacterized protein isoform X2 n=1 Tax=Oryza sativa subsp. japonica TaxID=39947 RepID=UPI00339BFC09
MAGHIYTPTVIMGKLLSDNGSQEFGDFKLVIHRMLSMYLYEKRILGCISVLPPLSSRVAGCLALSSRERIHCCRGSGSHGLVDGGHRQRHHLHTHVCASTTAVVCIFPSKERECHDGAEHIPDWPYGEQMDRWERKCDFSYLTAAAICEASTSDAIGSGSWHGNAGSPCLHIQLLLFHLHLPMGPKASSSALGAVQPEQRRFAARFAVP